MRRHLFVTGITLLGLLVLVGLTRQPASAGEKIRFQSQHINFATRFDTIVVGDEPGHFIAFFEAKGLGIRREGPEEPPYKIEIWGTGDYRGDGTGKDQGYGKFTFADGSTYFEEWTGEVSDGRNVGTAVYFNGSGRFKGMMGGSKFDCALLGDRFICEVEGTIELP